MSILKEPTTIDNLWNKFQDNIIMTNPEMDCSFDKFILGVDYLYVINAIDTNDKGEIYGIN